MTSSANTPDRTYLRYDTARTDSLSIKPAIEDRLRECPQAILWCNDGLFGWIPVERVRNAIVHRNEKRGAGIVPTPLVFHWYEAIVLPPGILANAIRIRRANPETR